MIQSLVWFACLFLAGVACFPKAVDLGTGESGVLTINLEMQDTDNQDKPHYSMGYLRDMHTQRRATKKSSELARYGLPSKTVGGQYLNDLRESLDGRILQGMLLNQNLEDFKTKNHQGKVMRKLFGIGRR